MSCIIFSIIMHSQIQRPWMVYVRERRQASLTVKVKREGQEMVSFCRPGELSKDFGFECGMMSLGVPEAGR